ncbi:hypothetical protein [Nonomuraea sp. LPB2021202275-12-8]|uniref:hypothetical protein n=1 Tax=Nonomuraea sp. LPB2021202275-12-8 TaxID=3120159 RepID=UPI00300C82A4
MNERDELARLLPPPVEHDLPPGRHRLLKEFVMTEIQHRPRRRLPRPAVLAAVLTAAVAGAVALPALLGGAPPASAYTVAGNPDGTITIKIYEARDAKGLQADLRERGFNVIVDYIPAGKRCSPQPRSATWVPGVRLARPQSAEEEDAGAGFRIDPSVVRPGQTAVLEFLIGQETGGHYLSAGISDRVSAGPVAECVLVDKPGGVRD